MGGVASPALEKSMKKRSARRIFILCPTIKIACTGPRKCSCQSAGNLGLSCSGHAGASGIHGTVTGSSTGSTGTGHWGASTAQGLPSSSLSPKFWGYGRLDRAVADATIEPEAPGRQL